MGKFVYVKVVTLKFDNIVHTYITCPLKKEIKVFNILGNIEWLFTLFIITDYIYYISQYAKQ